MGQPKFPRKKYDNPWQGDRIKAENEVKSKWGLKNKREIWKSQTRLREIRGQARTLISRTRNPADTQASVEAGLLMKRLFRQGYVGDEATLNDVLGMDVERILGRRLQSQVYLKGLARTPKQARQFISHGCVLIGDRRVTVPSYVVRREEEDEITIDPRKSIASEEHPVRPRAAAFEAPPVREAAPEAPAAPVAPAAHVAPAKAAAPVTAPETTPKVPEAAAPVAAPAAPEATPAAAPVVAPEVPEPAAEVPETAPEAPAVAADADTTEKEASE